MIFRGLVLIFALTACAGLNAQTFGQITGTVTDASGAIVSGAKVTVTNAATNATRTSSSNSAGIYSFPSLPPGTYNVKVELAGFRTAFHNGVEVQVQQVARVDFAMQVGQVNETVEVKASAAMLSTENSTVGTVIENQRILELPLNGRNYLQLVSLAPNVSFGFPSAGQAGSRQGGIRADESISVSGMRAQFNRYTLDGVENTDPNFNTFVVMPSVDALQEFKVQTGIYPAEFGRGATQINVSTKPGTNEYHGTVFHFLRNDRLDAKNYAFTSARPPKDPFKWNQFGFTLGGPISIPKILNGKDRLFFMVNYEWFRQRRQVQSVYSLPSAAMQTGDFSSLPDGIFDPLSRTDVNGTLVATAFPGNAIPTNRINATSQKLLEFLPVPNLPAAGLKNNFVEAQGRPIDRDQFVGRFDVIESSNSQWAGRYSWGDEDQTTEALKENGTKIVTNFKQVMVSNTRILSASTVNEFRFGYTKFYNTNGTELAFTRNVVQELGIPGLDPGPPVQWGIPNVSLQGVYSGFGNDSEGPYENNNSSLQFIDNLSWIHGKHSFRFGGEIRNDHYDQVGNQFARGQFTFTVNATQNLGISGPSGDPFADYLLGQTYQAEAAVSIANAQFRSTGFALYVDDSWKVTQHLTVNLGLRYEMTPPWEDQTGKLFNGVVPHDIQAMSVADRSLYPYFERQGPPSNDPYAGIRLRWTDIDVRQDGALGNRLVGIDKNDFAPRLGINWSPTDKWVIRTGAGMFYSQDTGNPRFDMARNLAGRTRFNSNTQTPDLTWDNAFAGLAGAIPQIARPYTFANPYDRRTPYTMQYVLNVERELPFNTMLEVGYLGSESRRLESLRAVNEAIPVDPRVDGRSIPDRSPFPNFGRIQLVDNGGKGNYNSLAVKLTKRMSQGVTFLMSYTWSKSIDTASSIRNLGGDTLFPQNSYCRQCERALSGFDVAHRFVTSGLWTLPIGKGQKVDIQNRALNVVAGGWQLGSILTLQTGFPVTVTEGLDNSNTGAFFDRPDATGIDPALSRGQQDPQLFFNTLAFVPNALGTHGNVGRNTLIGPGIIGWDFSLHKDFNFTERYRLEYRFEAFNFPNHPNWGLPNTNIASSSFGRITGTRTNMRNLQMALKFVF